MSIAEGVRQWAEKADTQPGNDDCGCSCVCEVWAVGCLGMLQRTAECWPVARSLLDCCSSLAVFVAGGCCLRGNVVSCALLADKSMLFTVTAHLGCR